MNAKKSNRSDCQHYIVDGADFVIATFRRDHRKYIIKQLLRMVGSWMPDLFKTKRRESK